MAPSTMAEPLIGSPRRVADEVDGRADQADVGEGLREVAQEVTGRQVDLFGEQSKVVDPRAQRLEQLSPLLQASASDQVVGPRNEHSRRKGSARIRAARASPCLACCVRPVSRARRAARSAATWHIATE